MLLISNIQRILKIRHVNGITKKLLKPVTPIIPRKIMGAIPVVGKVNLELPEGNHLLLESDGSDYIATMLFWFSLRGFEYETIMLFYSLLKYSETVFDIGASTGIYTLISALNNKRKVFAFEPLPAGFRRLNRNIEINGCSNIKTVNAAVGNYDGDIKLYIPEGFLPTDSSTLKGFRKANKIITIPAVTLDSFVAENTISRVDLIKMDTEGTEHLVLEGARNILKRDEPIIICEVLKGITEKFLHSALDSYGYKYYWITDKGLIQKENIQGDATYKFRDYLFITESRKKTLAGLFN
jgi:FkbM family methyltransferase